MAAGDRSRTPLRPAFAPAANREPSSAGGCAGQRKVRCARPSAPCNMKESTAAARVHRLVASHFEERWLVPGASGTGSRRTQSRLGRRNDMASRGASARLWEDGRARPARRSSRSVARRVRSVAEVNTVAGKARNRLSRSRGDHFVREDHAGAWEPRRRAANQRLSFTMVPSEEVAEIKTPPRTGARPLLPSGLARKGSLDRGLRHQRDTLEHGLDRFHASQ